MSIDQDQLAEMFRGITERLSRAERDIDDLQLVPISPTTFVYDPNPPPGNPSAYDDEFSTGTLDAKWTAINCATGTVDMLALAAAQDTYDLTTYTGMLALQPGQDDLAAGGMEAEAAIVRQTVVLGGTCKALCKINFGATVDTGGHTLAFAGIMLSGATGFDDNDYLWGALGATGAVAGFDDVVFIGEHNIGGAGAVALNGIMSAQTTQYLMITKTVNDFSIWSSDGRSWNAATDGAAPDATAFTFGAGVMVRLSLFCYFVSDVANEPNIFNPISVFDYVRYFTNNTPLVNA